MIHVYIIGAALIGTAAVIGLFMCVDRFMSYMSDSTPAEVSVSKYLVVDPDDRTNPTDDYIVVNYRAWLKAWQGERELTKDEIVARFNESPSDADAMLRQMRG